MIARTALVLAAILAVSPAVAAAEPQHLGVFGGWNAYAFDDDGGKVCFMSAKPAESKGKYKTRGEVLLFVTHWPDAKAKNVVSVSAGYGYGKKAEAALKVDGESFHLATEGETAWSKTEEDDASITAAIRKGKTLVVEGASSRGTKTTDTFDLKGSADALDAIEKACAS
jgi:Invasion associated locus B (IalB) protein